MKANVYKTRLDTGAGARNTRQKSSGYMRILLRLTLAGGMVFWVTTILTSLLPLAAEYRAAFSNWSIQSVWLGSLFSGLLISCCVSYSFLRYFEGIPAKGAVLKSVMVSACALILITVLIDVPRGFQGHGDALLYSLIGFVFNLARFLLLGTAIGWQYKRLSTRVSP